MLVEAKCIASAFDNRNSRHYTPGYLQDYDTDNEQLNSLLAGGKWVFQYPGHEGGPGEKIPPVAAVSVPEPSRPKVDKRNQKRGPMNAEQRQRMKEAQARGREAKKAKLEAAAA